MKALTALVILLLTTTPAVVGQIRLTDLTGKGVKLQKVQPPLHPLAELALDPRGGPTCSIQNLQCGQSTSGSVSSTDCELDIGQYVDFYEFFGEAGDVVVLQATHGFEALLALLTPSPESDVIAFDDGIGFTSITFTLTQTGFWNVGLANVVPFLDGSYTLSLGCNAGGGGGGDTCTTESIACNSTVTRTLTEQDCDLDDGTFVDFFEFLGTEGQTVSVDARSNEFDTFLFLLDPAVEVVATDDDSGDGTDAHLDHTLPESGLWTIAVNGFGPQDLGTYVLDLECTTGGTVSTDCIGRATSLTLHEGRFLVSGAAFLRNEPSTFFLQNLCTSEDISSTALAFFFNQGKPVQEGFVSIRDGCGRGRDAWVVEVASASTRRFWIDVTDSFTGLTQRYENPIGGFSAFFPADATSFAASCDAP